VLAAFGMAAGIRRRDTELGIAGIVVPALVLV
jgi:hypothetical protein